MKTVELPAMQPELATRYEHVWKKIMELWGTLYLPRYLKELVIVPPERGRRVGFSQPALDEILFLAKLHDERFPHHAIPDTVDDWDKNRGI